jgi:hypothetical protein
VKGCGSVDAQAQAATRPDVRERQRAVRRRNAPCYDQEEEGKAFYSSPSSLTLLNDSKSLSLSSSRT